MSIVFYTHPRCSTCKAAKTFLDRLKISYTVHDITQRPPSKAELKKMLVYYENNIKKLFNTSGESYREMNLKEKISHLSVDEAIELLHTNGMLVKRPFLLTDSGGLLGFNEDTWNKTLNK